MDRSMPLTYHVPGQARTWTIAVAMLLLVLSGCDWPNDDSGSGPDYRDHLSTVGSVSTPDSAALGSVFEVTFATFGPNGCWHKGRDVVRSPIPLLVRITPYDREYIGGDVCPQNAPVFQHVVPITATQAGKLKIEVLRRLRAVSGKDSIGVIEKFVTVY